MPAAQARAARERARQNMPAAFGSVEHCGTPNNPAPAEWVLRREDRAEPGDDQRAKLWLAVIALNAHF